MRISDNFPLKRCGALWASADRRCRAPQKTWHIAMRQGKDMSSGFDPIHGIKNLRRNAKLIAIKSKQCRFGPPFFL
jgi:hypothetical protein